ncbi:hypothetical protein TeGR_g1839 [Tetraparma gracilis]|uniref:Uncharacterized protein n=1 Tax=Tetraparma gracilis TaxID=2962635 RepID=A0ABQ6MFH1_9STRA|nr:hypothetical protein TeGR_g1839 [Tetraparma gracilis]
MNQVADSDTVEAAKAAAATRFRKHSIADGAAVVLSKANSVKHLSRGQLRKLPAGKYKDLAGAFHEMVQGGTGGTRERAEEFVDDMVPSHMHFFLKDFLVEIAVDISPAMKQARWGLFFQVARAGGVQYADEISDAVVLHEQYTGGEDGTPTDLFWTMFYILLLPVAFNVIWAVVFNKRKGAKAVSLAVLVEILHLGPVVKGWKVWKGEGMGQDDVLDPYQQFITGRFVELMFEGLPELVLATTMLYTGKATTKVVIAAATPSQKAIEPVGRDAGSQAEDEPTGARVEELERQLAAKDEEMHAKDARHGREMRAKDEKLRERDEKLEAQARRIAELEKLHDLGKP